MVFLASESFLKLFVKAFEKDGNYTKSAQFPKEKLVVCSNLVKRKLLSRLVDDALEGKGDKSSYTGLGLAGHEQAFILRGSYPESYVKFI